MEAYSAKHPVDAVLTQFASEAVPSDAQLVADKLLPPVKVPARSGTILIENARNFMGDPSKTGKRAPGADRDQISSFDRTSQTFTVDLYGLQDFIPIEDLDDDQYPAVGGPEGRLARRVARAVRLAYERDVSSHFFGTGAGWTTATAAAFPGSGGLQWAAGVDILTELDKIRVLQVEQGHGIDPDTLVIGRKVADEMRRNPEVRGYAGAAAMGLAAGGARVMSQDALVRVVADVLGMQPERVFIGAARYESAMPGASSSEANIWGKTLWLGNLMGGDPMVGTTGGVTKVTTGPVATAAFEQSGIASGFFDTPHGAPVRRSVYVDHRIGTQLIDVNLGYQITSVVA